MTKDIKTAIDSLNNSYNKTDLEDYFLKLITNFITKLQADYFNDNPDLEKHFLQLRSKKPLNKSQLAEFCYLFFNNEKIVKNWFASLSSILQELIKKAVWNKIVSKTELEEIIGYKVIELKPRSAKNNLYQPPPEVLLSAVLQKLGRLVKTDVPWHWGNTKLDETQVSVQLSLPSILRQWLAQHFDKPEGYYFIALDKPDDNKIVFFSAEQSIFRELPLITQYHLQGNIKFSQKGYPNQATAKKMEKQLRLQSFPGDEEHLIRSMMLAGIMGEKYKPKSLQDEQQTVIKNFFEQNFDQHPPAPYLLSYLKGINYFYAHEFRNGVTSELLDVIKQLPPEKWVSANNLPQYIQTHFIETLPLSTWAIAERVSNTYPLDKYEQQVTGQTVHEAAEIPHILAYAYLLAAWGLAELAIDTSKKLQHSPYDGLHAFRLTNLGSYVLGLTKTYTPVADNNGTLLHFDETGPFIRVEGNIDLAETMLIGYTNKVGDSRFHFSPGKFLKDCRNANDLKNKISLFKQTVGKKLPLFWENYLAQLLNNAKAVAPQKDVTVFNLTQQDRELLRLVAQDEILRKLVAKAEHFSVIVANDKLSLFVNRMKELGYLVG